MRELAVLLPLGEKTALRLFCWLALVVVLAAAACTRPDTEEQPVPVLNIDMSKPITEQPDLDWLRLGEDRHLSDMDAVQETREVHLRLRSGREFVLPSKITFMEQEADRIVLVDVAPLSEAEETFSAAAEKLVELLQTLGLGNDDDMAAISVLEKKLPQPIDPYFPPAPVGHRIVVDSTSVLARIRPTLERDMRWYFSLAFESRGTEGTTNSARAAAPRRNAH